MNSIPVYIQVVPKAVRGVSVSAILQTASVQLFSFLNFHDVRIKQATINLRRETVPTIINGNTNRDKHDRNHPSRCNVFIMDKR